MVIGIGNCANIDACSQHHTYIVLRHVYSHISSGARVY
jgi:hypothetical protein